jgi:hypothetical protein
MTEDIEQKLGRRDALKIMVAGAGAITASAFLPEKWVKPVAEFGVSPVHAQASIAPAVGGTISGLVYACGFTDSPISGAIVSVVGTAFSMITGPSGLYSFPNVPPGNYSVNCVAYAGPTGTLTEGPVSVTVGGTVTQDFNFTGAC